MWEINIYIIIIIFINLKRINAASSIYFTQPKVEVSLPTNIWQLPEPVFLFGARALVELTPVPLRTTKHITYHLTDSSLPTWINLNQHSGDLNILPSHRGGREKKGEAVVFVITARLGTTEAEMTVELTASEKPLECSPISQELCFWKHLKFQFYENQPIIELGSIAPSFIHYLCPKLAVIYTLNNDSGLNVAQGETGSWNLRTHGPADREDDAGPRRSARIACVTSNGGRGARAEKDVTIEVLDQDDNPPIPQKDKITVWLSSYQVKMGDSPDTGDLMFTDRDSPEANHYQPFIHDFFGLVNATCQEWSVDPRRADTAVHCGIKFLSNNTVPETPQYTATLTLDNTSLLPGNTSQNRPQVKLLFKRKPKKYGLEIFGNETIDYTHSGVSFPREDISVSRNAAKFENLVQPVDRVELKAFIEFRLVNSSSAFNITPRTGIVYVINPQALHSAKWNKTKITIEWEDAISLKAKNLNEKNISSIKLIINIITNKPTPCYNSNLKLINNLCSEFDSKKDCVASCGISSAEHCKWRNQLIPINITSTHDSYNPYYSTCSPSLKTCPDGYCDELEMYHPYICPQDCTDKVYGSGLLSNVVGARGIKVASGVCSCGTLGTCTCFKPKTTKITNKPRVGTTSSTVSNPTSTSPLPEINPWPIKSSTAFSECGDGCLLSVIMGSILFLSGVVILTLWLRRRRLYLGVRAKRKFTVRGNDSETEAAREDGSAAVTEEIDLDNKRPLSLAHLRPDPKWEFPRERLRIEQVLGEGEFGRVLRASAKDMPGVAGRLAVAVKTLKDGAGSAELNDLLSEYELLKEVSHPNVIRLLGACTMPGGPVYIIIEFAKHGALRSYLRRSRRLEVSHESTSDAQATPTPITPRDLLSFAWQISKGMQYLSDIKLVHRDLAARNVLVATGGVCKISDFGLTRDVYEDDAYFKQSKGRVPVKWMAIESLADHIYTSKSDVWSFGILLWELITLGSSPYPGIAVQNLFHLLRAGYRMERPENCSYPLYRLMQVCWEADPLDRPAFKDITVMLDNMLQDGTDYLELSPRVVHNQGYVGNSISLNTQQDSDAESEHDEVTTSTEYGTLNSATLVSSYVPMTPSNVTQENIELSTSANNSSVHHATSNSSVSYKSECKYVSPLRNNEQIQVQETKNINNATSLNYLEIEPSADDYVS